MAETTPRPGKGPAEPPWHEPTPATGRERAPLSGAQVHQWRTRGFALVDGLFPRSLLDAAVLDARRAFPAPGAPESRRHDDFGSGGRMAFPTESQAANEITLHPRLLAALHQLLDVPVTGIRLTQSDVWPKYGRPAEAAARRRTIYDNEDQRFHVDYPNHTLTHPPTWDAPEAVECILYMSDVDECGGATGLVPREGPDDPAYSWPIVNTPGVGALEWRNDRASAERYLGKKAPEIADWRARHLYPREIRARYRCGTLLLYRHDTWHRGTPLLPESLRIVVNMTFRKAGHEWVSTLQPGWAWGMYRRSRVMERLIATASVEQRCVLGFPAPGSPYWNDETRAAVRARYGPLGFDISPYR